MKPIRHGEDHPNAKLTKEKVVAIKAALKAGAKISDVAKQYGVVPSTIRRIREAGGWTTT